MGERETCAACGRAPATYALGAVSPTSCSWSPSCGCAHCAHLCWHFGDIDECAAMLGGWPAIVAAARAEVERLRERDATLDAAATALDCAPREVATVAARMRERATGLARRTAADERADVAAFLRAPGPQDTGEGYARRIERGAHVGAAKGGERG